MNAQEKAGMRAGADYAENSGTRDFGAEDFGVASAAGGLPAAGDLGPVVFGPDAIRAAALRLSAAGHVIVLSANSAETGFLPPALPAEQTEAEATPDPVGYLLRRRIARAIALDEPAVGSDKVARPSPRETLRIGKEPDGRPRFDGGRTGLHLSFASRGGTSLIGVARNPIGVDLELLSGLTEIPWNILRTDEIEDIQALPEDRRIARFLMLWTAKESTLKAMGTGLSTPPEAIRIVDNLAIALRRDDGSWQPLDARIRLYCNKNAIFDAVIGFPHLTIALALLSRAPQ